LNYFLSCKLIEAQKQQNLIIFILNFNWPQYGNLKGDSRENYAEKKNRFEEKFTSFLSGCIMILRE
jgi:hypothetical protein